MDDEQEAIEPIVQEREPELYEYINILEEKKYIVDTGFNGNTTTQYIKVTDPSTGAVLLPEQDVTEGNKDDIRKQLKAISESPPPPSPTKTQPQFKGLSTKSPKEPEQSL